MKLSLLERIYGGLLLVVFAGIVIHAPLSVGFGTLWPHYSLLIKSWKEIILIVASVLALIIVTRRQLWQVLAADILVRLVASYTLLHIILALCGSVSKAVLAGLLIDLRYIGFFLLVYILMKIAPVYRLRLLTTVAIGALVVIGFGALQLFLPHDILKYIGYSRETIPPYLTVDKNPDYVRISSTLRGPNPLGAYTVIVLAVLGSIATKLRGRFKTSARRWSFVAMVIASMVVLWVSYSRSALIAAFAALGIVMTVMYSKGLSRRRAVIIGATVAMLTIGTVGLGGKNFFDNVILHDNPTTGSVMKSDQGHLSSLQQGFSNMLTQPFGAGIGSTGSASLYGNRGDIIENQYLFVAHETGWLGLVLFLSIFVLILNRLWRTREDWLSLAVFASGVGLAIIGLLLPVWADDTVSIIWWGLAGIALFPRKEEL
jgi:hypothetical protein